ncbi:MAG: hypothetical protein ACYCW6_19675 [Candidatus Xenobia bacterium]
MAPVVAAAVALWVGYKHREGVQKFLIRRGGPLMGAVAVLLVIGLAVVSFVQFGTFIFFFPLFNWMSSSIFAATGLNLFLVKGFSVFATLLLLWLGRQALARRTWARVELAALIGLTCIGWGLYAPQHQFFDYRSGHAMRWYARTPEGIHMFDAPGYDPKYGIPLQPVDAAVVSEYSEQQDGTVSATTEEGIDLQLARQAMSMGDLPTALTYLSRLPASPGRNRMLQHLASQAGDVGRYDLAEQAAHLVAAR